MDAAAALIASVIVGGVVVLAGASKLVQWLRHRPILRALDERLNDVQSDQ